MAITQILLYMDGVLCDFQTEAVKIHRPSDWQQVMESWPQCEFGIHKVMGISITKFWSVIDKRGAQFWAELPSLPWCDQLLERCRAICDTTVLSTPSMAVGSVKGKYCWLQKKFGYKFRGYAMTPHKHLMAKPGHLLIDDCDENCERFVAYGGQAILFLRRWNKNHAIANGIDYALDQLESICGPVNKPAEVA